mmetsp:Transcript_20772/g.21138  ORF Transcript_20772/g.21138 Transcript_20772/m.21138 type:complete len:126 (+) Transcript_20772:719-1096(+)
MKWPFTSSLSFSIRKILYLFVSGFFTLHRLYRKSRTNHASVGLHFTTLHFTSHVKKTKTKWVSLFLNSNYHPIVTMLIHRCGGGGGGRGGRRGGCSVVVPVPTSVPVPKRPQCLVASLLHFALAS